MGLCVEHYNREIERRRIRSDAIDALDSGLIDGKPPQDPYLAAELAKIHAWWRRARDAIDSGVDDKIFGDEIEGATNWCIALTIEIVKAEKAVRIGNQRGYRLEAIKIWVWDCFNNLEIKAAESKPEAS